MIEVSTHKRDDSLDFIKVLATIAVLKLHVGWQGYAEYAGSIVQYMCGCAVPLFFMVSGGLALNRSLESTRGGYYLKKARSILVLILTWGVIFFLYDCVKSKGIVNPIDDIFGSLLQKGYLDHFWFLWALMFLYLLSPMLRKLFTGDKERNMTTIVFLLLMAICFCVNVSMGVNCLQPFETNVPQSLRIWSHLGYYWLGACLYRIVKSEDALRVGILSNKKLLVAMTVILWISMAFIQYGLCRIVMGITSPEYIFDSPAIILTNISIFICCIVMKENIVVSRGARLIQYSLGIYILHPFVIRVLEKILPWINMGWPLRWLILFVASMFTTAIMLKIPVLNKLIKL